MKVDIQLALAAIEPSGTKFAITTGFSLPHRNLGQGETIYRVAEDMFCSLLAVSPGWIPLKQVGAFDGEEPGTIDILHAATIPEAIPLRDTSVQWVDFATLNEHPRLLMLMGYAVNYYRMEGSR